MRYFGGRPNPPLAFRQAKDYTSSRSLLPDPLSGARISSKCKNHYVTDRPAKVRLLIESPKCLILKKKRL